MAFYLVSTTAIPHGADGTWIMSTVSPEEAVRIAGEIPFTSAVWHGPSAKVMTAALGVPIKVSRITVAPMPDDLFLCFHLLSQVPEGVILDRDSLNAIEFTWALLSYEG